MSKTLTTLGRISVGAIVGAAVSVGAFFAYKAFTSDDHVYSDLKPSRTIMGGNGLYEINETNSNEAYLGDKGVRDLATKIDNELGYGPEIMGINNINLVENGFISDDNNGVFIEATKQIFINTSNLRKRVGTDKPLDARVEAAYQIIFHEYLHFLTSSYVKKTKQVDHPADLYSGQNRQRTSWDNYFVTHFKNLLGYNDISKYTTTEIDYKGTKYHPISSQYSTKQLFDIANGKASPHFTLKNNSFFGGRYNYVVPSPISKANQLGYLYSIDELYVRKYQQMEMILKDNSLYSDGWIHNIVNGKQEIRASSFLIDTLRYQPDIYPHSIDRNKPNWRYAIDSPYGLNQQGVSTGGNAEALYDLMTEENGMLNGADIAYIIQQNNTSMVSETHYDAEKDENGNAKTTNPDLIKFGGYVPSSAGYKYVGYMDGNTYVPLEITVHNATYGYKQSLNSQIKTVKSNEDSFYTLNDFVNAKLLAGKELYFSSTSTGVNKVLMTSVRDSNVGSTDSFFDDAPSILRSKIYKATIKNSKVYIGSDSWT